MTTQHFRNSILDLVQEHFILTSCFHNLTDLSNSLVYLSSYKLSNMYYLLQTCCRNDMLLNLDDVILLVSNYAASENFTSFLKLFTRSALSNYCKITALQALCIVNYLNLTFDESVSQISGADIPETALT